MASNKAITLGPVALTITLTTNVVNAPTLTGGTTVPPNSTNSYYILRHIRIVNKTVSPASVSLWKGATGANTAGTEFGFQGTSIAANSYIDWYGALRLDTTDFIVGGSNTATALSFEAEGEMGVA